MSASRLRKERQQARDAQNWKTIADLVHQLDHRHKEGDPRMADDDVLRLVARVLRHAATGGPNPEAWDRVVIKVPLSPEDRVRLAHAQTLTLDVTDLLP